MNGTRGWSESARRQWVGGLALVTLVLLGAAPAWSWTLEEAARPYKGTTVRLGVAVVPVMEGLLSLIEKEFVPRTGIDVKIEKFTHDQWDPKGDADLYSKTGYFDLLQMHSNRAEDWATNGHVRWINEYMDNPKLRDPALDPGDFVQPLWDDICLFEGGKRACFLNYNFQFIYWFRKDLVTHAEERPNFKKRYGYDLGPARTYKQYRDIAEFFTRKKGERLAGKVLDDNFYGTGLVGKREPSFSWEWHVVLSGWGGSLFDKEGRPTYNSKENVEATKWWFDLRKFAPPGVTEAGFVDLFVLMTKGNVAQAFQWIDFAFAIDDPKISKAVGVYSYDVLPVREKGMTPGGWGEPEPLVISKYGKNPEAAYLLIQWMSSKDVQKKWIEGPGSGLPLRKSSMALPFVKKHAAFAPAVSSMKRGWFDPGFSNYIQIREELTIQLTQAAAGQQTVEQALGKVQELAVKIHPSGPINPGRAQKNHFAR
jgi:multiple sugar transport system substrate-binding protein